MGAGCRGAAAALQDTLSGVGDKGEKGRRLQDAVDWSAVMNLMPHQRRREQLVKRWEVLRREQENLRQRRRQQQQQQQQQQQPPQQQQQPQQHQPTSAVDGAGGVELLVVDAAPGVVAAERVDGDGLREKVLTSVRMKRASLWTEEEDAMLKELVEKHEGKHKMWVLIAQEMRTRDRKTCRERFTKLDPEHHRRARIEKTLRDKLVPRAGAQLGSRCKVTRMPACVMRAVGVSRVRREGEAVERRGGVLCLCALALDLHWPSCWSEQLRCMQHLQPAGVAYCTYVKRQRERAPAHVDMLSRALYRPKVDALVPC